MEDQIQVTSATSESNNEALSTHSSPELQPCDSTHKTNSIEGSTPIAAATQLSATTLFEILSSIVTNIQTPNTQTNEEGAGPSSSQPPPIQLQLQLNPQQPDDETIMDDTKQTKTRGRKTSNTSSGNNKDKQSWHFHLGGVRQRRIPLSPEIKEALEVAYVSRIMSKNYRKEGQPEKERISRITGLEMEKVHEWFKNRRKKDKLLQSRSKNSNFPRAKRGRKPIIPDPISSQQHEYMSTQPQQQNLNDEL